MRIKKIGGISLIELMITVAILSIGVLAAIGSFRLITESIQGSKARTLSNNLAQEQIEKLKNLSYYLLLVTTSTYVDTRFSPNLEYDTGNYPTQSIMEGGMTFTRGTRVDFAYHTGGVISTAPWTSNDTGLKLITTYVIWRDGTEYRRVEMHNLMANPAANPLNASFTGTVTNDLSNPVPNALVQVVDNPNWFGFTNSAGVYQFNVSQGSYTLHCSSAGHFPSTTPSYQSIVSGESKTVNFVLGIMSSGTAVGYAYINDHMVISQVVGSTYNVTAGQCQEYVELYNPTTSYIQMVQGMAIDLVSLKVQNDGDASPTTIDLDYTVIDASVPPNGYFLIANYPTVAVNGITMAADAVISNSNAAYPNVIRSRGGPNPACEPDIGDADAIGIAWTTSGVWIDQVGWQRNGLGHQPEMSEGSAIVQGQGLEDNELFVRYSGPGVLSTSLGRSYDTHDNATDFEVRATVDMSPLNRTFILPSNSGTPATGALISLNDPLSQTGSCVAATVSGKPVCSFNIPSIATGSWTMVITSNTYYAEMSSVTIVASVSTSVPNGATIPIWTESGSHNTMLNNTTNYAFVAGVVTDANNAALSGIAVNAGGQTRNTSTSGRYFISVPAGDVRVTANYGNQNLAYTSQSSDLPGLVAGTVYDIPAGNPSTWFTLSLGGILRGYFRTGSNTPLPGRAATALVGGNQVAQAVSGSDGYFYLNNLTTGTYTIQPALDPAETVSPSSVTVTLTSTGTATNVSTFTITSGLSEITGQVLASSQVITTGVLVIASTVTLSGGATSPPPSISGGSSILCNPCSYAASSDSSGRYTLSLRSTASPYKVYGWYTTFSGTTPSVSRSGPYTVNVSTAGQILSQNISW